MRASTSIFMEKPATARACCTALVMLPALHTWLSEKMTFEIDQPLLGLSTFSIDQPSNQPINRRQSSAARTFQHDHLRQVVPVRGRPAHQQRVLLHGPEPC